MHSKSAADQSNLIEGRRLAGREALLTHDLETAEASFVEALQMIGGGISATTVQLYCDLAETWANLGRFKQAQDLLTAAERMAETVRQMALPPLADLRSMVAALRSDPANREELGSQLVALAQAERFDAFDFLAARKHLKEAIAISMELAPNAPETALRRAGLVALLMLTGDGSSALALGDELRGELRAADPGVASEILRTTAQLRLQQGSLDAAAEDARQAIDAAVEEGSNRRQAAALSALALIVQERGDLESAAMRYHEAMDLFASDQEGSVTAAITLSRLGDLELQRGDDATAGEHFERSAEMFRLFAPSGPEYPQALSKLAAHKADLGHLKNAAALYRTAAQLLPAGPGRLWVLVRLGNVEKEMRNYLEARRILTEVLAQADEVDDAVLTKTARMSLAGVQRWLGDLESAEATYRVLLDNAADVGERGNALANLGGIHHDREDYARAIACYRDAIGLFSDRPPSMPATLVLNLATSLHGLGELEEADDLYAEAQRNLPGLSRNHVTAITGRARIAEAQGRLDDAIALLADAVQLVEQIRGSGGTELFAELQRHYATLQSLLERRGAPNDAGWGLELAEMTRYRALEEGLRRDRGSTGAPVEVKRIRRQLATASRRRMSARADPATPAYLLDDLERQERELGAALKDLDRHGDVVATAGVMSAGEIANALPPGTLLIEFAVVGRSMHLWAVTVDSIELSVLSADVETLTQLVVRAVGPCHVPSAVADLDADAWRVLGEAVLETVRDRTDSAETLMVSPAGPLHYVSFEPFVDGPAIVYVPSATVALRPPIARSDDRRFAAEFVGFGNPAFDSGLPEFAQLPSLPGAELEVTEIAALFGEGGLAMCGDAAVEPEVRAWARRCRYLHLATHGIADLENPLRSGLVLASPTTSQITGNDFDDMLYGYEMVDLRIEAELVVCASCYSGYGDVRAGEGMATMGGALLQGGARWVLVTLWPVGDLITATFTLALYRALISGADVPAAVAVARTEIREYHEHPRWWAPFVLFGVQR